MSDVERFSDELLNAYVDGELADEDRRRIEQALARDEVLRRRVDALLNVKRLTRDAYIDERPAGGRFRLPRRWPAASLAASVAAFALGVAVTWGWMLASGGMGAGAPQSVAEQANAGPRVMFHVSRENPARLGKVLDEVQALFATSRDQGHLATVRIVATDDGLALFKRGAAPLAGRIRALQSEYGTHLILSACGVGFEQLKRRQADPGLKLIPQMQLVDLGVLEITRRQQQGWAYIHL